MWVRERIVCVCQARGPLDMDPPLQTLPFLFFQHRLPLHETARHCVFDIWPSVRRQLMVVCTLCVLPSAFSKSGPRCVESSWWCVPCHLYFSPPSAPLGTDACSSGQVSLRPVWNRCTRRRGGGRNLKAWVACCILLYGKGTPLLFMRNILTCSNPGL